MSQTGDGRQKRHWRSRNAFRRKSRNRLRLSVFRSSRHIYAQVIDDGQGHTLCQASSLEKAVKSNLEYGGNRKAAEAVGKLLAERAKEAGIDKVAFDRGAFRYHGRVRALADAAREAGLVI